MNSKSEQTLWASQEAVIKAEINQAKNTFDLVHMADAIVRLDALHAEMEAASKSARMSCGDSAALRVALLAIFTGAFSV